MEFECDVKFENVLIAIHIVLELTNASYTYFYPFPSSYI